MDSESESEDSAHVCLIVQGDDPLEVNSKSNLNCDDISIDELGEAFELSDNYDLLKKKFSNFKKEKEVLQSQLEMISKENISISLKNIKKNFDVYKVSFKAKLLVLIKMRFVL